MLAVFVSASGIQIRCVTFCNTQFLTPTQIIYARGKRRPGPRRNVPKLTTRPWPLHGHRRSHGPVLAATIAADDAVMTPSEGFFVAAHLARLFEEQHKTTGAREASRETASARSMEIARRRVSWGAVDLNGGASPTPLRSPWAPLWGRWEFASCCKSGQRTNFECGMY